MKTRIFAALAALLLVATSVHAAELRTRPLASASSSAVAGISFSEPAASLPIDTRFSQSIQTVAFDLGLTCGQIEAYGWSMGANDQARVDALFTNTAVELNKQGYRVQPQNPSSVGEDITVYTATRADDARTSKLFVWSAGDAGLLLLLCDAKGDLPQEPAATGTLGNTGTAGFAGYESMPADIDPAKLVGVWEGTYTCRAQGQTGGKLTISKVKAGAGENEHTVEGIIDFFPTAKNPNVERGSYKVSGTFNSVTQQGYFDPGKWLKQPKGYIAKPLITYFDLARGNVSAIFQDTTGCTSFEARLKPDSAEEAKRTAAPAKKKVVKKKPKPKPVEPAPVPEPSADEILPLEPVTGTVPETTGDAPVTAPVAAEPTTAPVTVPDAAPATTETTTTTTTTTVTVPETPKAEEPKAAAPSPSLAPAAPVTPPSPPAPVVKETTTTTTTTTTPTVAPVAAPTAPAVPAPTMGAGKPVVDVDPTASLAAPAAAPTSAPSGPIVVPNKTEGTAGNADTAADALAKAKAALDAADAERKKASAGMAVPPASEPKAETPAQ